MGYNSIEDIRQQLQRVGILKYRSSISSELHDLINSYWRLPNDDKHAMKLILPKFAIHNDISIDWDALCICREQFGASNSDYLINVAWVLALQASEIITSTPLQTFEEMPYLQPGFSPIQHFQYLPKLLSMMQPSTGEYYISFLIVVGVLEKLLYHLQQMICWSMEELNVGENIDLVGSNPTFKDLLESVQINEALPQGLVQLLKTLFLPHGLNLRNLAWHGFLIPAELPQCFSALTFLVTVTVVQYLSHYNVPTLRSRTMDGGYDKLFTPCMFDSEFVIPPRLLAKSEHANISQLSSSDRKKLLWQRVKLVLQQSMNNTNASFIPKGRHTLVKTMLSEFLINGNELLLLYRLLPVYEHAIRIHFVKAHKNVIPMKALNSILIAQKDEYYSTLDGFGQRNIHQVLLHPIILSIYDESQPRSKWLNKFYSGAIPTAALAIMVDLFMMGDGPNFRAKLCHGKTCLASLFDQQTDTHSQSQSSVPSIATQLLLLSFCSLIESPNLSNTTSILRDFKESFVSSFHPIFQLQRAMIDLHHNHQKLQLLHTKLSAFETPRNTSSEESTLFVVWKEIGLKLSDTVARIKEFEAMCCITFSKMSHIYSSDLATEKSGYRINGKLEAQVTKLSKDLSGALAKVSTYIEQFANKTKALESTDEQNRYLLGLTDKDGLGMSPCMLEIMRCVIRIVTFLICRQEELCASVAQNQARTTHRRQLLKWVWFTPLALQFLTLAEAVLSHRIDLVSFDELQIVNRNKKWDIIIEKFFQYVGSLEIHLVRHGSVEKAISIIQQFLDSKGFKSL